MIKRAFFSLKNNPLIWFDFDKIVFLDQMPSKTKRHGFKVPKHAAQVQPLDVEDDELTEDERVPEVVNRKRKRREPKVKAEQPQKDVVIPKNWLVKKMSPVAFLRTVSQDEGTKYIFVLI